MQNQDAYAKLEKEVLAIELPEVGSLEEANLWNLLLQIDNIGSAAVMWDPLTMLRAFTYASVISNHWATVDFLNIHAGMIPYDKYTSAECVLKVVVRLTKRQLRDQVGYEYI